MNYKKNFILFFLKNTFKTVLIIFILTSCSNKNDPSTQDEDSSSNGGSNGGIPSSSRNADIIQIESDGYFVYVLLSDNTLWKHESITHVDSKLMKIADDVKEVRRLHGYNTVIIKKDNTLWGKGDNRNQELGLGHSLHVVEFTKIAENVKTIADGWNSYHLLFIKNDNTLWGCGNNGPAWTLAYSDDHEYTVPRPIKLADNVKAAAAGDGFSFMVKNDGSVWSRGANEHGMRGIGYGFTDYDYNRSWVKIADDGKYIKADVITSGFVKADNSLWMTGVNNHGQFGIGSPEYDFNRPIKVYDNVKDFQLRGGNTTILLNDNTLWISGEIDTHDITKTVRTFQKIADNVALVAGSGEGSHFVKRDGTLWQITTNNLPQMTFTQVSLPWKN